MSWSFWKMGGNWLRHLLWTHKLSLPNIYTGLEKIPKDIKKNNLLNSARIQRWDYQKKEQLLRWGHKEKQAFTCLSRQRSVYNATTTELQRPESFVRILRGNQKHLRSYSNHEDMTKKKNKKHTLSLIMFKPRTQMAFLISWPPPLPYLM